MPKDTTPQDLFKAALAATTKAMSAERELEVGFGADAGDQKRIMTPAKAIQAGADYLVVGRPVTEAKDPLLAVKNILKEMG